MKKVYTACFLALMATGITTAQVTQINNNNSLELVAPLNNVKTLFAGDKDSTLWVSEGTLASTVQISTTIFFDGNGLLLNGKYIFRGITAATGTELYITDGTTAGTLLLKDVNPGAANSDPSDMALMNGIIYFTAKTPAEGRELWRTDGTAGGTVLVKDINAGPASSNEEDYYHLASFNNYLLFAAVGTADGVELWKSDGTAGGTFQLKDINPGPDSSNPQNFYPHNNLILFTAKTAANGDEFWRTDGTGTNTFMLADINPGPGGSSSYEIMPGFSMPLFYGFHTFKNKVYFNASNGTDFGTLWNTDGSTANTTLVKVLVPGAGTPQIWVFDAINLSNKFLFPVSDGASTAEIWETDGTPGGTVVFKSFHFGSAADFPFLLLNYGWTGEDFDQQLFQGNKFFLVGNTLAEGNELWVSDGTLGGTTLVKDISAGTGSGITDFTYMYTTAALFFAANNGGQGNELWRTDATPGGTTLVKDIYPGTYDADPVLFILNNQKIFFGATEGDDISKTDLYVVDGNFNALPLKLRSFTANRVGNDALLSWQTMQEVNTSHFSIQRSLDGIHFEEVGKVNAAGNSQSTRNYTYTDAGITQLGKDILYYKLMTTDKDGKKQASPTATLRLNKNAWHAQLVANVPGGPLSVVIRGNQKNANITLSDLSGRTLYAKTNIYPNTPVIIPATYFNTGAYFITVSVGTEKQIIRLMR